MKLLNAESLGGKKIQNEVAAKDISGQQGLSIKIPLKAFLSLRVGIQACDAPWSSPVVGNRDYCDSYLISRQNG